MQSALCRQLFHFVDKCSSEGRYLRQLYTGQVISGRVYIWSHRLCGVTMICFWGNGFSMRQSLSKQNLSNLGLSAVEFLCPALLNPSGFTILALAQLHTNTAHPRLHSLPWGFALGAKKCVTIVISSLPPTPSPSPFSQPVVSLWLAVPQWHGKEVNLGYFGNGKTQKFSSPLKKAALEDKRILLQFEY